MAERDPESYQHPDEGIDHDPADAVAQQGYRPWPQIWNRVMRNHSNDILSLFDWMTEKADRVGDSITPQTLGNAPTVFSSQFDTIQEALDAAGSGHLFIEDTKTEDGITISEENDGVVIEWIGDNWVEQPASPTLGESVFHAESSVSTPIDVTFIRPQIRNPNLADSDIENEDTLPGPDRTSAIEWFPPASASPEPPASITVHNPHIHHVNGYGINIRDVHEQVEVNGGQIYRTCFDSVCASAASTDPDPSITFTDVRAGWSGRHNFCIPSNPREGGVYISGYGEDAYTAGLDVEHGSNITLDLTVKRSGRATAETSGTSPIHAGLYVSDPSYNIGGHLRAIDPEGYAAYLKAPPDGLTISHRETRGSASPAGHPIIWFDNFEGGTVTINSEAGGVQGDTVNDIGGLVFLNDVANLTLDGTVIKSYGASLTLQDSRACNISLSSRNPHYGGPAGYRTAHVMLQYSGGIPSRRNNISLTCSAGATSVNHIVNNTDNNKNNAGDYNRYSGTGVAAYETEPPVRGLNENSDASDLLSLVKTTS